MTRSEPIKVKRRTTFLSSSLHEAMEFRLALPTSFRYLPVKSKLPFLQALVLGETGPFIMCVLNSDRHQVCDFQRITLGHDGSYWEINREHNGFVIYLMEQFH